MEDRINDVIHKFPPVCDGNIELTSFLNASKGMANLIDDLGKLFSPLSYDMNNNIAKIEQGSEQFGSKYLTIEDLLSAEREQNGKTIFEALVWLTRALLFWKIFFQCLIDEKDGSESLESSMIKAYQGSLEPHHGWATRQLFSFFKKVCPPRSVTMKILEKRLGNVEVITELIIFSQLLEVNIEHINAFCKLNNFNNLIVP